MTLVFTLNVLLMNSFSSFDIGNSVVDDGLVLAVVVEGLLVDLGASVVVDSVARRLRLDEKKEARMALILCFSIKLTGRITRSPM